MALNKAEEVECDSIALPAISSGIFGFPLHLCAEILIECGKEFARTGPKFVRRIAYTNIDEKTASAFQKALGAHGPESSKTATAHIPSPAYAWPPVSPHGDGRADSPSRERTNSSALPAIPPENLLIGVPKKVEPMEVAQAIQEKCKGLSDILDSASAVLQKHDGSIRADCEEVLSTCSA